MSILNVKRRRVGLQILLDPHNPQRIDIVCRCISDIDVCIGAITMAILHRIRNVEQCLLALTRLCS